MKKTLVLTVLSLALLLGNIGTKSARAHNLSKVQINTLKHNLLLSKHKIDWYHGKGHWTLHERYATCKAVARRFSLRRGYICYQARVTLRRHTARYNRIYALLHPWPTYYTGSVNWDALVGKCEAKSAGWYADTGNGFYFGPQFTPSTWHANHGGPVYEMDGYGPHMSAYSIDYIKHIAYNVLKSQGPRAWPNCYSYLYEHS